MSKFSDVSFNLASGLTVEREAWNGMQYLYKATDGVFLVGVGVPANTVWEMPKEDLEADDWVANE